jgi:Zn-dependent peptidase ImmA (M78 family)/DNA-binding XRE family transcriptional regulator
MMFKGKRIRQARELRRLTQGELARLIGKSQAAVAHAERGFKEPSADLVSAVALQTRFPISFFTTDPPVDFPVDVLLFRARSTMTRRDAQAAARYAEIIFEMGLNLSSYVTTIPLKLERTGRSPVEAAREARRWLGLSPEEPIPHLVNAMERAGILVLAIPLEEQSDIDAFSAWVRNTPVVALCAGKMAGDRKRFSAGHELGHLVLHFGTNIRSNEHKEADEFSAELLMPERAMRREITTPVTLTSLAALKPRWGVSIQTLIYRAHQLGIIADRQYRYLFEQVSIRGWRTREPENLDIPVERPRTLRKIVELLPFGNNLSHLASDLHLSVENVQEILSVYDSKADVSSTGPQPVSNKVIPLNFKRA